MPLLQLCQEYEFVLSQSHPVLIIQPTTAYAAEKGEYIIIKKIELDFLNCGKESNVVTVSDYHTGNHGAAAPFCSLRKDSRVGIVYTNPYPSFVPPVTFCLRQGTGPIFIHSQLFVAQHLRHLCPITSALTTHSTIIAQKQNEVLADCDIVSTEEKPSRRLNAKYKLLSHFDVKNNKKAAAAAPVKKIKKTSKKRCSIFDVDFPKEYTEPGCALLSFTEHRKKDERGEHSQLDYEKLLPPPPLFDFSVEDSDLQHNMCTDLGFHEWKDCPMRHCVTDDIPSCNSRQAGAIRKRRLTTDDVCSSLNLDRLSLTSVYDDADEPAAKRQWGRAVSYIHAGNFA